ncbi:MAG TPA: hypothetical protein VMX97_18200 [Hyphomicrobiaceae bacterium]|nr:hypothetical protein [Hyphomicrobiaceae bacterium]
MPDSNQTSENAARQAAQDINQGATRSSSIRDEDVGTGERYSTTNADHQGILFANEKRTADEYQDLSLNVSKRGRALEEKLDSIAVQALQNSVETANMIAKQAVRHGDIAIDRQWNVDEQAFVVKEILNDPAFEDALKAGIVAAAAQASRGK